jgi:hypothetical protein
VSISLKVYNKIGYEDVRKGMTLRIITEGPGIKSDVEGTVLSIFQGWRRGSNGGFALDDYGRVSFRSDPATAHVVKCPEYAKDTSVELYEVIDAIPDEPKGVGAVVCVNSLDWRYLSRYAVKTGPNWVWPWSGPWGRSEFNWDSISSMVLDGRYDYIKVLSKGVEL